MMLPRWFPPRRPPPSSALPILTQNPMLLDQNKDCYLSSQLPLLSPLTKLVDFHLQVFESFGKRSPDNKALRGHKEDKVLMVLWIVRDGRDLVVPLGNWPTTAQGRILMININ